MTHGDPVRARFTWRLLALVALGLPGGRAAAQDAGAELRGVVLDDAGAPLPFANVVVAAVQRSVLANAQGRFALGALPAGPVEVLFRQVGFAPVRRTVQTRPVGTGTLDTIRLTRLPILLDKVVVVTDPACTTGGFDAAQGPQVAALFDLARQNAEQYWLLATQYPIRYRIALTRRFLKADGSIIAENQDTIVQRSDERTPYAIGRVLQRKGGTTTINVPSAVDVGEPAFRAAHCFRYAGTDTVAGRAVHRVDFLPTARVKTPDAAGSLYLDATTGLLRRGSFRLVQLPGRGTHIAAFEVTTTYREVQPFRLLLEGVSMAHGFRNVIFPGGVPVARQVEEWELLDFAFITTGGTTGSPAPGAAQRP